ncbi:MAG TPA: hypothetical protein P5349_09450 [Tenuifilaceae bacterium]|nr:hypothetical protein [Tenuifilaceae bacterium]
MKLQGFNLLFKIIKKSCPGILSGSGTNWWIRCMADSKCGAPDNLAAGGNSIIVYVFGTSYLIT